jgi:L-2,4-diaminobutyric acid acetyltransferase
MLYRRPCLDDGQQLHHLIASCPPLDPNSLYCNFLQCSHFSETSVVVEQDGRLLGSITAYLLPDSPDTLFVWQVAVDPVARGKKLAANMLKHLIQRLGADVHFVETTITPDNASSWALFKSIARDYQTDLTSSVWLDQDSHFYRRHASEHLIKIGPLNYY